MGRKTKGATRRQSRPSSSDSSSDAPASAADLLRLLVFVLLLAPLVVAAIPTCGILQVIATVVLTVLGAAIGARVLPSWLSWLIATTMARSAIMVAASPLVAIWSLFWIAGVDFVLYDIILWMVQSVFTVVLLIVRPVGFFWRWTAALSPRTVEWATVICVIPPLSSALGVPLIVLWPTLHLTGIDRIIFYVARLMARPFTIVEKLWCEDRGCHMYGVFAMAPDEFNIQICPGTGFQWYGDYECSEGHKKTTNGNYLVDLINARVFDLSSSHGHDGLAFAGWIMRELDVNGTAQPGVFELGIKGGDGKDATFKLHRFVHHVAHHHGVSIFAEGALQAAGFDLGGRVYEHILGYRPINERSDVAIVRQIRASKRSSNQSDVDHGVGRDFQWTNGILHCWACSHRINTCAIHVRVLENDWCYLLQKRKYRGGVEVTDIYDDDEIDNTNGALQVGLFDGLTSYDPKKKDGGVDKEDCDEAIHLWAESLVGKAVRVFWGKDYAHSDADIGWYEGKVLSYSRKAKKGFTILFVGEEEAEQMELDAHAIGEPLEDLAKTMTEDDLLIHGGDSAVGGSSAVDSDSDPSTLDDIGNTPHQAFSAPPRPKKKQRTSFSGDVNDQGLNLFNAFRRERD